MNDPTPRPAPPMTVAQPSPDTRDDQVNRTASQPTPATSPAPAGRSGYPFLGPPDRPDDLGRLGPYRVVWLLGEGGMGFVFEAEDDQLRRPVALKVMRPEVAAGPIARDRFLREGRAAAALKNDHVTTIYQVGEANGVPFLAMELLEGCTLDEWLRRQPGPVAPKAVAKVARNVLRGLAAAHAKGLVHRDIKPANLWVEKGTNRVKLLDFGLTRLQDDQDRLTRHGQLVGTPAYMAPEQADGRTVDARADLFSVGVVLHRMLTGRSPFERETVMATLTALATVTPPPARTVAPALPGPLADLIDRLLARDPANRPADAGAALAEWQAAEKQAPSGSPPSTLNVPRLPFAVPVEPPATPADAGPWYSDAPPREAAPTAGGGTPADTGLDLEPADGLPDNREAENLLDGVNDYIDRDTTADRQMRRDRRRRSSRSEDRRRDDRDDRGRSRGGRDPIPPALPAHGRADDLSDAPPPPRRRKRGGFPVLPVVGGALLFLVFVVVAAVYALKSGSGTPAGWVDYSPPDGLFSARFPAAPQVKYDGGKTTYSSRTPQMEFLIIVADAPGGNADLTVFTNAFVKAMDGTVREQRDITQGGVRGKELTMIVTNAKVGVRIFALSGKTVVVVAGDDPGPWQESQATAFLTSVTFR